MIAFGSRATVVPDSEVQASSAKASTTGARGSAAIGKRIADEIGGMGSWAHLAGAKWLQGDESPRPLAPNTLANLQPFFAE